jgi:hypothetical protein
VDSDNGIAIPLPLCGSPIHHYTPPWRPRCATCGEQITPEQEAAEVYASNEGEVTSRLVQVGCIRPGEVIA